jgi:DNA repair protein RadC
MKDTELVSELKVSYHPRIKATERQQIKSSKDIHKILEPFYDTWLNYREVFFVVYLNRNNKVLGVLKISEGGLCQTMVDIKIIVQGLVLSNATQLILSHNHPSGNNQPSESDIEMTKRIKAGFEFLDVVVLDHLILVEDAYYSFADNGLI